MAKKSADRADMRGEEYLEGRREGVEGTYGESRGGKGAEKTVLPDDEASEGGGEGDLASKATSMYRRAVRNEGGGGGDKALTER